MLKKTILILTIVVFNVASISAATFDSFFDTVDGTMNRIDRAQNTYDKIMTQYGSQGKNDSYSSGGSTTYPDKTAPTTQTNRDIPEYNADKVDVPETQYEQSQNNEYTSQVKTLKDLPAGTLVMDPSSVWKYRDGNNYSGDIKATLPVIWRKLEDNHYTQGSTLLLSEVKIAEYPFCHSNKGLRAWDESDARRFLRTTFYNHFSEGFKNAIVNVSIPYADLSGNPKTILDNFFYLSIVEWGLSDRAKNGKVIKYDNLPSIYAVDSVRYVDSWNALSLSSGGQNWTRTINRPVAKSAGYTNDVFMVKSDGVLTTNWFAGNWPVRPAVNLKSTTQVKGPYKLKYSVYNSEYLIYYALAF